MNTRFLLVSALTACLALPVAAQVPADITDVGIDTGWREADGRHMAGLTIRLAPGWKTYWRAPGDGGIAPSFNWSGSSNVASVDVRFPVPHVFYVNGMRSIGYKDAVIFPLVVETLDPTQPIRLNGEVELGVCEDICVPVTLTFAADLPSPGSGSAPLQSALGDRPETGDAMRCEVTPIADGLRVAVTTDMPPMASEEVAVIEAGESGLWISEASVVRKGGTLRAEVEMVPPNAQPFALARADLRLTVLADGRAVEILGCS